jgi:hypothetical protein
MALTARRAFLGPTTVTYAVKKNDAVIGYVRTDGKDYICLNVDRNRVLDLNVMWIGTVVIAQMNNRTTAIVADLPS